MTEIPIPEGFYIGRLCKRGHEFVNSGGSLRYSSCLNCVECSRNNHGDTKEQRREYHQKYYRANRERAIANVNKYKEAHAEEIRAYHEEYRKANREKIAKSKRLYYLKQKKKRFREAIENNNSCNQKELKNQQKGQSNG